MNKSDKLTKKQYKTITDILSNPSTIEWFKKTYGEKFMEFNARDGRLHFDMGLSHSLNFVDIRKVISYNNDIIGLFFKHPDYCNGFSQYKGGYPVTCSCWKGAMYINCLDNIGCSLYGYGTREIIGMILGYIPFPEIK